MPTRTIHGAAIHYDEAGKGLSFVLVHGFPLDNRIFDAQHAEIEKTHHVIRPDLRGFGKSQSTAPFTIASLADDLHALLKEIDALPCVLGGLSMGGYVSLAYARRYASDLRGLILIDTRSEADTSQAKEGREKMIALARGPNGAKAISDQMFPKMLAPQNQETDVGRRARQIMESQSPLTIEHALMALRDREDYTGDLPSIAVPTLIVVGAEDAITPPDMSRKLNASIPRSRLVEIPGAGHLSPMEQPAAVSEVIGEFIT